MRMTVADIEQRLASHSPDIQSGRVGVEAAVAAIVREYEGQLELLFIRRAEYDGDPWSGDLAFPGGRRDPGDASPQAAALRETLEELSLDLRPATYLGQLSDVVGLDDSIRVSAFVYGIDGDPYLKPNYEIREAFWSPFAYFIDPERREWREWEHAGQTRRYPGIRLLEDPRAPALWGMTYQFLSDFMKALGHSLPEAEGVE